MRDEESVLGVSTIRRNRGVTLEQIAASTKISIRTLDAIERGQFQKLPGGIYDVSYIRQYARAIDYDESLLLEAYRRSQPVLQEPQAGRLKSLLAPFRTASDIAG